jgi:hypothetical protein
MTKDGCEYAIPVSREQGSAALKLQAIGGDFLFPRIGADEQSSADSQDRQTSEDAQETGDPERQLVITQHRPGSRRHRRAKLVTKIEEHLGAECTRAYRHQGRQFVARIANVFGPGHDAEISSYFASIVGKERPDLRTLSGRSGMAPFNRRITRSRERLATRRCLRQNP